MPPIHRTPAALQRTQSLHREASTCANTADGGSTSTAELNRQSADPAHRPPVEDHLKTLFKSHNWVEDFAQIMLHQPRLGELICQIDNLLPKRNGESTAICGLSISLLYPARNYLRAELHVSETASPAGIQGLPRRNSMSDTRNMSIVPASPPIAHTQVIGRILTRLLSPDAFEAPVKAVPPDAKVKIDIKENSLVDALSSLGVLPSPASSARQPPIPLWSTSTKAVPPQRSARHALTATAPPSNGGVHFKRASHAGAKAHQNNLPSLTEILRSNRFSPRSHPLSDMTDPTHLDLQRGDEGTRQPVRVTNAQERTAIRTALMIRQTSGNYLTENALASEEWVASQQRTMISENLKNPECNNPETTYFETFCPGISQQDMVDHDNPDPQFKILTGGTCRHVNDIEQVISEVRQSVLTQLQSPDADFSTAALYPMFVYETLSRTTGLAVPQKIRDAHELKLDQLKSKLKDQQAQLEQNRERVEKAQAETRLRKQLELEKNTKFAIENKLAHPRLVLDFTTVAAGHPDMIGSSVEHSFVLGSGGADTELNHQLHQRLRQDHELQEVSSSSRSLQALADRSLPFTRDNLCWLRATWLSILTSHPDAAEIAARLDTIGTRFHKNVPFATDVIAALHQDLHTNRNGLLHVGEEGGFSKPAHFRSWQLIADYLTEKGIDIHDPRAHRQKIELMLKHLTFSISMGARGTEKPRFSYQLDLLTALNPMMDSDFVMGVHRVLERPCLIIERKVGQFLSIKFSGPVNDTKLDQIAQNLVSQTALRSLTLEDIEPLLVHFVNVPIIRLIDDHYSVYLPKSSRVVQQPTLQQTPGVAAVTASPVCPPIPASASPAITAKILASPLEDETPITGIPSPLAIRPPEHSQVTIQVNQKSIPIAANVIYFESGGFPLIVGQTARSEVEAKLQAYLLQTSGSRQARTWFEFVSPRAALEPDRARYPGTIYQLQQILLKQESGLAPPLIVNGMKLNAVSQLPNNPSVPWLKEFQIEWVDLQNPQNTIRQRAVVASPNLSKSGALSPEQLHQCLGRIDDSNEGHALMSAHGIVRSAALAIMCKAREAIRKRELVDGNQLQSWLEERRAEGIRDRGPYFLHNQAQYNCLLSAILQLLESTHPHTGSQTSFLPVIHPG